MAREIFLVTPGSKKNNNPSLKRRGKKQAKWAGNVLRSYGFNRKTGLVIASPVKSDTETAKLLTKQMKAKEKPVIAERVYDHTNNGSSVGKVALAASVAEALISIPAEQPNEVPVAIVMCPERIALDLDIKPDNITPGSVFKFSFDPKVAPVLLETPAVK